ncbi:hypothetical protein BDF14DRAFT_1782150 [Spinellus fusiger]|nr:hypothetical protein BDF14DRAFT_1782138 [Spinellus fusiger]KAI7869512.1 hypothetical protein BDF14DRAFT_1782150 [Spinellus fusiger]
MDIHHSFLLPYSTLLNPMEGCWSIIKGEIRNIPFGKNEMISDRVEKTVKKVTPEDCQGWIRHSQGLFTKCMTMEKT